MKTKVYHIVPVNKIGGVENAAKSSNKLLNYYFDFKILYLIKSKSDNHLSFISGTFQTINFIKNNINNNGKIIIISSLWKSVFTPLLLKILYRKKIKWVHFLHSKSFFSLVDMILSIIGIRLSDEVIADSLSTSLTRKNFTNKNIKIISFQLFKNIQLKKKKKINKKIRFMFLGRISKVKNLTLSIKIIEILFQRGIDLTFDIYGPKEDDYDNLLSIVNGKKLNKIVKFKNELNNDKIIDIFSKYDFYLQTSKSEGMGMSVVEAMMNGLVCIVTPVGEIINYSDDMISAIHINTLDDIEKIIKCIKNPNFYQKISINANNNFKSKLTYAESINDYLINLDQNLKI